MEAAHAQRAPPKLIAAAARCPAGGASFVTGGPRRAPPSARCRAQTERRRHFALLREAVWEALEGGGGSDIGSDNNNSNSNSGSGRGYSCCSGLASPFAQPRGQDSADMSDVEENNFEGRVSGRPCPGRAERGDLSGAEWAGVLCFLQPGGTGGNAACL